jgi:D-alanyl-D-alanine carboxypeptidase-like protein
MSRALDDLAPDFRVQVFEAIARLAEHGVPVFVVDTLRTKAEQEVNLRRGVSRTMNSKHLPDKDGFAHAIDLCPYSIYQAAGPDKLLWQTHDTVMVGGAERQVLKREWRLIGEVGEKLGLRWGGRFESFFDAGHFEQPQAG